MLVNCLPSQGACPTRFPRFSPRYRARATSLQPYAPKFYRVPSHFTVTPHPDNDDYQISRGAKPASPSPNTMNSFGVIEVASTKTKNAPGWAYVPDVGPSPAAAALQPTNRKRAARNQSVLSASDLSARQEAKIRKDLEALDRDIHKDAVIPIPLKGGASRSKETYKSMGFRNLNGADTVLEKPRNIPPTCARYYSPRRLSQTTLMTTKLYSPWLRRIRLPPRR